MSFTILFIALALLVSIIIFGLTYKLKGLKTALIAMGIAFVGFALLFVAVIFVVVILMSN